MHHQDQTKTPTPGYESNGVYICHKCAWPFPNPHPSAKTRRAHKKICGTIDGYKEEQTHFNGSDDDFKTQGLVVSGLNNEEGSDGMEGKLVRTEDEVFSGAVADFSDSGQSLRDKDSLRPTDFNGADESPLIANSSNDCQIKNLKILQSESFEAGNIAGLQPQFPGSSVDPLTSSITDLKTEESSIVHGKGFSGLSSDSSPIKAESDIYAGENVTDRSLIGDEKEFNLNGSDEVKEERDMVENVESTDNVVGETSKRPSKIVVGANPEEKKESESLSIFTDEAQVESSHAIQEKEGTNIINIDPLIVHDDILDVAYPQSESLKHEEDVTGSNTRTETENIHTEQCSEASLVEPSTKAYQRSHEIEVPMKTEMNENHFPEEHGPTDIHENSQPESSFMVSSHEIQRESSFQSATEETFNIINISDDLNDTSEINDVSLDGKVVRANVGNDTEVVEKDFQPSDLLQSEVEQSSNLLKSNSDDTVSAINEDEINSDIKLYEEYNKSAATAADSHDQQDAQLLGKAEEDPSSKHSSDSTTNIEPYAQHDSAVEDDSHSSREPAQDQTSNNFVKLGSSGIDISADSHEARDAQLLVKATEDLASNHTSHRSNTSAQDDSAVENDSGGEAGGEASRIIAVPLPVQEQSAHNSVKLTSPGTDASVDFGSRRDSLDRNWGSSSAVIDAENLSSTLSPASTEAGKSNLNLQKAALADRQLSGKSETFELPSFTTLVESSCIAASPKSTASEIQNPQPSNSTSQAVSLPTLNQVIGESQGKQKNEEIITKTTNRSSRIKEHTPLKSLLGESTHSSKKPKSLNMEENNNGSGLTTVNSILGPESPSASKEVKGVEASNEWNSPARYPANIKREKKKSKSRPFWMQFVCCSAAVDPQRRR